MGKDQLKYNPFKLLALKMNCLKNIRLLVYRRSQKQNHAKPLPGHFPCVGKKREKRFNCLWTETVLLFLPFGSDSSISIESETFRPSKRPMLLSSSYEVFHLSSSVPYRPLRCSRQPSCNVNPYRKWESNFSYFYYSMI